MATTGYWFDYGPYNFYEKDMSWVTDTIKVALLTSTATPNRGTWQKYSDITNEVTGTGYTSGGATLANCAVTVDTTNHYVYLSAANVSWASSTITARYAVIYDSSATNSPLIGYVDFGQDYSSNNGTLQITWDANGIFKTTM